MAILRVKGADGNIYDISAINGKSAYQIWLDLGNVGTEQDFIESLKGETGEQGETGAQGDKGEKGDQGIQGIQGIQGEKGDPFFIAKVYPSVDEMNLDFSTMDVSSGQFVLIDTGNVEDEDNAKLYYKGLDSYVFLTDLSGATGLQGPQGVQGVQGIPGADYVLTDADKIEIANLAISLFPVYEGEVEDV
jgi:hypothetical protein